MKKRILSLLITAVIAVSFSACSDDEDTSVAGTTSASTSDSVGDSSEPEISVENAVAFDEQTDAELFDLATRLYAKALKYAVKFETEALPHTAEVYEDENGMFWIQVDPAQYKSINDVKSELDSLFVSSITSHYLDLVMFVEHDGLLYIYNNERRGADGSYQNQEFTSIKEVSADRIVFEETINRKDASTGNTYFEIVDFTIIIDGGNYKIESFTFPY